MKKISIPMADNMPEGCEQPEPVLIEINQPISQVKENEGINFDNILSNHAMWNWKKACDLADALTKSLPQGIMEPLIIELMERKVSYYHGVMKVKKDD